MHRADHVVEAHEVRAPEHTEQEGTPESTYKPFDSFLRRELDQGCAPDRHAPHVCKYIIANNQRGGDPEPNHTLEDVVNDEVTRNNDQQQAHVNPAEEAKLLLEESTSERHDETNEANGIKRKN